MKHNQWYWYTPAVLWGAVILILTSLPRLQPPPLGFKMEDKLYHFLVYFLFGIFLARAWTRGDLNKSRRAVLKTLLFGLLFAAADEFHQQFIPGRFCDIWDATADMAGIILSVIVFHLGRHYLISQERSLFNVFIGDTK